MSGTEHIEVFAGANGVEWYWRVRSANGQIVDIGGESYTRKWNAMRGATRRYPRLEVRCV